MATAFNRHLKLLSKGSGDPAAAAAAPATTAGSPPRPASTAPAPAPDPEALRGGELLLRLLCLAWYLSPGTEEPADVASLEGLLGWPGPDADAALRFVRSMTAHELLRRGPFYAPFFAGCHRCSASCIEGRPASMQACSHPLLYMYALPRACEGWELASAKRMVRSTPIPAPFQPVAQTKCWLQLRGAHQNPAPLQLQRLPMPMLLACLLPQPPPPHLPSNKNV